MHFWLLNGLWWSLTALPPSAVRTQSCRPHDYDFLHKGMQITALLCDIVWLRVCECIEWSVKITCAFRHLQPFAPFRKMRNITINLSAQKFQKSYYWTIYFSGISAVRITKINMLLKKGMMTSCSQHLLCQAKQSRRLGLGWQHTMQNYKLTLLACAYKDRRWTSTLYWQLALVM